MEEFKLWSFLSLGARGMKDTVAAAVKTGTKVSSRVGEGNERVCDGYSRTARGRFFSRGARGMKDLRHRATRHDRVSSRVGEGNESGRALESGTKSMRFPLAWDEGNERRRRIMRYSSRSRCFLSRGARGMRAISRCITTGIVSMFLLAWAKGMKDCHQGVAHPMKWCFLSRGARGMTGIVSIVLFVLAKGMKITSFSMFL